MNCTQKVGHKTKLLCQRNGGDIKRDLEDMEKDQVVNDEMEAEAVSEESLAAL